MPVSNKPGVQLRGMQPQIAMVPFYAESIWRALFQGLVVTSVCDGKHSPNSLHYKGLAIDLRTRYFNSIEKGIAAKELQKALGDEYDVVVELTHIHVEWDPKR